MKNYLFTKAELESIKSTFFEEWQIAEIKKKTPESEIEIKTDESGLKYKSVKISYVEKQAIKIFGWNYDFEIKSERYISQTKQVLVLGRLTVYNDNGQSRFREQFGKFNVNTRTGIHEGNNYSIPSDLGNAYKSAASDAFKKCCSKFGICWDIYSQEIAEKVKEEVKQPDNKEIAKIKRLNYFLNQCKTVEDVEEVYNKFLETTNETEDSKELVKVKINQLIKPSEKTN